MSFIQAVFVNLFLVASASNYRPAVIMHGMNADPSDYQRLANSIKAKYPGIYVTLPSVYDDISSMLTHMDKQIAALIKAIKQDPNLSKGFNFYGESQGALLARTYVTLSNDPPVYNLIGLNGPQNGVGECPDIEIPVIKQLCGDLGTDLQIYHWPLCSFCSYWKGKNKTTYLNNSQWLANVNNDKTVNQTYRKNMISLNKYMATMALRDKIVQPGQSAWHTYWYWGDESRSKVMNLSETEGYKNDILGLRTLDERGDLILNSFDAGHCGYTMDWWNKNVLPLFDNRL